MTEILRVYLISDSTGETVSAVSRAAVSQFQDVETEEYIWQLIRTEAQIDAILPHIKLKPGVVLYTVINKELRTYLKERCKELGVPCFSPVAGTIREMSHFFNIETSKEVPGKYSILDDHYFKKIDTINFTIQHDDGNSLWDLKKADILLFGVSRTSKSPTSFYLGNRGFKTANIPIVKGCLPSIDLSVLKSTLIVGLVIDSDRLIQLRKHRIKSLYPQEHIHLGSDYTSPEKIKEELNLSQNLFIKHNIPILDVTKKAIEETSAEIINLYQDKYHLHKVML